MNNKESFFLGVIFTVASLELRSFYLERQRSKCPIFPTGGGGTGRTNNTSNLTDAQKFERDFYAGMGKVQNNYSNIF